MPDSPFIFSSPSTLSASDSARLSRIESSLPKSVAGARVYSASGLAVPAAAAVLPSGQISPSSGVSNTGSAFPFVVQGAFGFTWTANTLTLYWDGTNGSTPFLIRRTDGTLLSIPRGSLAILGLAGDAGSPRYAFSPSATPSALAAASQTQRLSVNESLTTALIYYVTGAATTATTGGGTGGGGSPYTGAPDTSEFNGE